MTYPVFGYQITLPDLVTATITIAGTTEDVEVAAGTYWGYVNGSGTLTGTLAQAFVTPLLSHSGWSTTPTASLAYGVKTDGRAYWRATFTGGGLGLSDTFVYEGSDSTVFDNAIGFVTSGALSLGSLGYVESAVRYDGAWAPNVLGDTLEPVYVDQSMGAVSPYDPSAHDRVRLGRRLLWICELPYVNAADISRELSGLSSGYLTLAGRGASETRGTLDDLLGAAGSDSEIRLVVDASTSYDCILDNDGEIRRDAYTSTATVGGRRYDVSLPLIVASTYDGVDT